VDSLYHGSAEFIGDATAFQDADTLLDVGDIYMRQSRRPSIIIPGSLNIHRHIINQVLLQQFPQYPRHIPVGIQLNGILQLLDLLQERPKVPLQSRLSSGDTDALENPLPFFQVREYFFLRNERLAAGIQHQFPVVTKRTAKIAAPCKNSGCNMFRII